MAKATKIDVSRNVDSIETSTKYDGYTGVRLIVGEDDDGNQKEYFAGDEDGRVLEVTNPFGTEQMAKDILKTVQDYKYQPLSVSGAALNPAVEIGDGIIANGVYSGIFKRYTTFGRLMKSDVEAPGEAEIDHEYAYETSKNREYSRFVANTKSSLKITSESIEAEVLRATEAEDKISSKLTQTAEEITAEVKGVVDSKLDSTYTNSSFGWKLTSSGFTLNSGSSTVFNATKDGITVTGEIKATSGYIGSESSGFKITGSAIYKNMTSLSDTTTPGIYIGTDGISLGGGKFKVTSSGALYATSGTFTGSVYANQIQVGGNAGYVEYSQLSSYNQGGVGGGYNFSSMDAGYYTAANVKGSAVSGYSVSATYLNGSYWYAGGVPNLISRGWVQVPYNMSGSMSASYKYLLNSDYQKQACLIPYSYIVTINANYNSFNYLGWSS